MPTEPRQGLQRRLPLNRPLKKEKKKKRERKQDERTEKKKKTRRLPEMTRTATPESTATETEQWLCLSGSAPQRQMSTGLC